MKKTNAMRILDGAKVPYTVLLYEDDGEHDLAYGAAQMTAAKLGVDPATVFKTIVMQTERKEVVVFCQSSLHEINLKKAREVAGAKEVSPVRAEDLPRLTGYVRGGCTPLGMRRTYRTFIDESALAHPVIRISAGVRGQQIALAPQDLVRVTGAVTADLVLEQAT